MQDRIRRSGIGAAAAVQGGFAMTAIVGEGRSLPWKRGGAAEASGFAMQRSLAVHNCAQIMRPRGWREHLGQQKTLITEP